tara:strand:+ start:437 stop:616 length:180 start_codon:yes stop_codon:yes gene_type:complete
MILEKRKGGGNRVLFSFSLSRTPNNTNTTNTVTWKEILICVVWTTTTQQHFKQKYFAKK